MRRFGDLMGEAWDTLKTVMEVIWEKSRSLAEKIPKKRFLLVLLPAVILLIVCVVLVFLFVGGGDGVKRSGKELCYDTQKSLKGVFNQYFVETGHYPASLEELHELDFLQGITIECPSGGHYTFIPGDPPLVKCSKHGFYE